MFRRIIFFYRKRGQEKYVSARKPAVQAVCSVKSCRKTGAHKHHTTVKHHTKKKHHTKAKRYNCGVSSCKITKKHTINDTADIIEKATEAVITEDITDKIKAEKSDAWEGRDEK